MPQLYGSLNDLGHGISPVETEPSSYISQLRVLSDTVSFPTSPVDTGVTGLAAEAHARHRLSAGVARVGLVYT